MKTISITRTHLVWLLAALALAFGALTLSTGSARAVATITVTNNNDSGVDSLRQAIADAGDGDTINFDNDYTITLESELTIDKNLTIDGEQYNVVVSGKNAVGIFRVAKGITFNLDHLTVTEGDADSGGGLYNNLGAVTITNSTFSANRAKDSGGGVYNDGGTLTITNSTLSANSAGTSGGGIFNDNDGTVTVTNSTFSGNSANEGSSIYNNSGSVALGNTLVTNSKSGGNCNGAITDGGGNLTWDDTTCPGIHADPKLSALGSYGGPTQTFALLPGSAAIDAGSVALRAATDQRGVARPQGAHYDSGAFESRGFTLVIPGGNNQSAVVNTAFTNPLKVSISPVSAGEPVNGGVVTFTPPASGASAVITGSPAAISGGHAQVTATANAILGSYNVNASTSGASTGVNFALHNTCAATITVTNSHDNGSGSLRQAIASICAGGTITFAGDTTIYLASPLVIDKNMTIDGAGHTVAVSGDTDNDGSGNVRVFSVNSGVTFNLSNLAVCKGYDNSGGGLFNNGGTVTITNSTFSANRGGTSGGGIDNRGNLTITNSTFSANSAGTSGGGIFNYNGTVAITNSTFSANSTGTSGGGIINFDGTVAITNSTFSANSAGTHAGGLCNFDGTVAITNSTFSANSAIFGGGIFNIGSATLRNSIIANSPGGNCNGAITDGGGNLTWGDTTCPGIHADPKLDALANNGGPTQTFALLPGSVAIDTGNDTTCPSTDQRGTHRPQGYHCDIGAYELAQSTYRLYLPLVIRKPSP